MPILEDTFQGRCICLPTPKIDVRRLLDQLDGCVVVRSDFASGRTNNKRVVRYYHSLSDQCAGTHDTIRAYLRAIQENRTHADQRIFANRASMKDRVVANGAAVTDREWKARIGVESTVILDVGSFANFNPLIVATKHRTEPNASANLYPHFSNDDRSLRYITMIGGCHIWFFPTQTEQRHSVLRRHEV